MATNYPGKYDLKNRVAVITSGGWGIGFACAEALAEAGAKIVLLERDEAAARDAASILAAQGAQVSWRLVEVSDQRAVKAAAAATERKVDAVDILVCCAGIANSGVAAEATTADQWWQVININLSGLFWSCQSFGRAMLERRRGVIVNIGSMFGLVVNRPQEQASYNASKAAVHQLTRSLAAEWATRGVRVNAVAPTHIDTPMTRYGTQNEQLRQAWLDTAPMQRIGRTDEVASVVLFLAPDASCLLTGSIVLADAGYTCW